MRILVPRWEPCSRDSSPSEGMRRSAGQSSPHRGTVSTLFVLCLRLTQDDLYFLGDISAPKKPEMSLNRHRESSPATIWGYRNRSTDNAEDINAGTICDRLTLHFLARADSWKPAGLPGRSEGRRKPSARPGKPRGEERVWTKVLPPAGEPASLVSEAAFGGFAGSRRRLGHFSPGGMSGRRSTMALRNGRSAGRDPIASGAIRKRMTKRKGGRRVALLPLAS